MSKAWSYNLTCKQQTLEDVGGVPALNLPDGIYPNPFGHYIIAENIWKVLEPLLQSLQEP